MLSWFLLANKLSCYIAAASVTAVIDSKYLTCSFYKYEQMNSLTPYPPLRLLIFCVIMRNIIIWLHYFNHISSVILKLVIIPDLFLIMSHSSISFLLVVRYILLNLNNFSLFFFFLFFFCQDLSVSVNNVYMLLYQIRLNFLPIYFVIFLLFFNPSSL